MTSTDSCSPLAPRAATFHAILDPAMTVDHVLLTYPCTVTAFNAFGVDTCCGGGASLEGAAMRAQITPRALLAALDGAIAACGARA
jgi:regulator of cell morphogenesis and NO signaling